MRLQQSWSTTAADNAASDPTINQAENMAAAVVNNSARAEMARIAAAFKGINGGVTSGGSANAYTFASPAGHALASSYPSSLLLAFAANHTNTGAATLNVDGLGAKAIVKAGGTALAAGDIVSGAIVMCAYDGTDFHMLSAPGSASYQPFDDDLTALAGLSSTGLAARTGTNAWAQRSVAAGAGVAVTNGDGVAGNPTVALSHLGLQSLADPNADRIVMWDDSAGAMAWLQASTGLSLSGTSLTVDAVLQTYAGIAPSANVQSLLSAADYAAIRALLDLEPGTDFLAPASIASAYQPLDSDLTAIAALSTTSFGRGLLALADAAAAQTALGYTAADVLAKLLTVDGAGSLVDADSVDGVHAAAFGQLAAAATWTATQTFSAVQNVSLGSKWRWFEASNNNYHGLRNETNVLTFDFNGTDYLTITSVGVATLAGSLVITAANTATLTNKTLADPIVSGGVELGHASDTTLTRASAGQLAVEGKAALQHAGSYTSGKVTVQSGGSPSGGADGDIVLIY